MHPQIRKAVFGVASAIALVVLLGTPARALASIYLEIPPIDGEQDTLGHSNVILVNSYSLGANAFTIVKQTDSTSDDLFLATLNGTNFPTASLLFYNGDPLSSPPDSSLVFQGVLVSSFQALGTTDQVTYSFQSVPEPTTGLVCAAALLTATTRSRRRA